MADNGSQAFQPYDEDAALRNILEGTAIKTGEDFSSPWLRTCPDR